MRRRHRARLIRFRTAGAALLTAAVAVVVPVLNQGGTVAGDPGPAAGATGETTATVMARTLIVPDVVGMTLTDAVAELRRGGLTADVVTAVQGTGIVTGQAPGQGKPLPAGGRVTLSARAILSDFDAQGRRFDGVHIGYLPDGLMWTKRDEKVQFGKQAADLTTFEIPHKPQGQFAVRVADYRGQVSEEIQRRLAAFTAHGGQNIEINGETAYLVNNSGGGTNVLDPADDDAEPLIGWRLRDGLAVEVYMSPSYARQIDYRAELRKIAENIRPDD